LNTTILKDNVVVLVVSILKNRGFLLNKNRTGMGKFFGFQGVAEFEEFKYI
jgi:hypothetical protein